MPARAQHRFLVAADTATPELRAFCHLLAWTGGRLSEALAVTPADLDAVAGCVAIRRDELLLARPEASVVYQSGFLSQRVTT